MHGDLKKIIFSILIECYGIIAGQVSTDFLPGDLTVIRLKVYEFAPVFFAINATSCFYMINKQIGRVQIFERKGQQQLFLNLIAMYSICYVLSYCNQHCFSAELVSYFHHFPDQVFHGKKKQ